MTDNSTNAGMWAGLPGGAVAVAVGAVLERGAAGEAERAGRVAERDDDLGRDVLGEAEQIAQLGAGAGDERRERGAEAERAGREQQVLRRRVDGRADRLGEAPFEVDADHD